MVIINGHTWQELKARDGRTIYRRQRDDGSWQNVMPDSMRPEDLKASLMPSDLHAVENQPRNKQKTTELGDLVEKALSSVGITKKRVSKWLGRPCGCQRRQEKLNQLSRWAKKATREGLEKLLKGEPSGHLLPVEFTRITDVVYPISGGRHGKKRLGSKWDNNELRYSLRSLEENFPSLERVFIVGYKPEWLTGVIHIPAEDTHRKNKDANLIDKVLLACRSGVGETFLRLSDDQCLLRPWDGLEVWHGGSACNTKAGGWWKRMHRTCRYLQKHARPTHFYDCHVPAPVDRESFIKIMEEADYQTPPGLNINTLYYNSIDIPRNSIKGRKVAFHRAVKVNQLERDTRGKLFLGYNEKGTNIDMKAFLPQRFPKVSRFEK